MLIVANRLPVSWAGESGEVGDERRLVRSPGGLVSALAPVAERMECAWLGTLDGSPNMEFMLDGMRLMAVEVERGLCERYYSGFANQVLWPVFHGLPARAAQVSSATLKSWWEAYVSVNQAFAHRIAEVADEDALVWVHDYHLLLVPEMLRGLRPDVRIALFIHIPFPEHGPLLQASWAEPLLRGLCAADLVGVQREVDAGRLQAAVSDGVTGAGPAIATFPISIDVAQYEAEANTARAARAGKTDAGVRERYGLQGRQVLLSIDRLDYTKGITQRVDAFGSVLDGWNGESPRPVLLQVLTSTRQDIAAYQEFAVEVREAVDRVNTRFSTENYQPIITLSEQHEASELVELFLAADVMCVTPIRDGMNLVAKEFVASRVDERGVLVLSRDAGSADELAEAVIVDPQRHQDLVDALSRAIAMTQGEQETRMRSLRARVRENDVHAWAAGFLAAAGTATAVAAGTVNRPSG